MKTETKEYWTQQDVINVLGVPRGWYYAAVRYKLCPGPTHRLPLGARRYYTRQEADEIIELFQKMAK